MAWTETKENGVLLRLVIQPKASRTEIVGLRGDPPRLKIRVAAPPVDGAANEEVIRFLAKRLGLARSQIGILRGEKGKTKDVFCIGLTQPLAEALIR